MEWDEWLVSMRNKSKRLWSAGLCAWAHMLVAGAVAVIEIEALAVCQTVCGHIYPVLLQLQL